MGQFSLFVGNWQNLLIRQEKLLKRIFYPPLQYSSFIILEFLSILFTGISIKVILFTKAMTSQLSARNL